MCYDNILFFAYLRPKESLSANMRLFFGVYRETRAEKSESGYNLKPPCVIPHSTAENDAHAAMETQPLLKPVPV